MRNFQKNRQRVCATGFTLVEMAVVMVLVGIMLSMSVSGGLLMLNTSAIRGTKEKQIIVRDALISYLRANGRLPCPDVGPLAVTAGPIVAGAALDGRENRASIIGPDPDTTANCANQFGTIPYVDLGLNRDSALDAYGNFMLYRVSDNVPPTTPSSDWVHKANFKPSNGGSMWVDDRVSALTTLPPVVVVLISHGKNGAGAWTTRFTRVDSTGAGVDELENAAGCTTAFKCYSKDITDSTAATGGPFDDIVLGITVSDLTSPLIADRSMKSPNATLADTFESIIDTVATTAVKTYIPASPPTAAYCTYTLPASTQSVDPWGQPVICAPAAIGPYMIPTLPAVICTITSSGRDLLPATAGDNVVRQVTNSDLISRLTRLGC